MVIFVAGLFHESNTFAPGLLGPGSFQIRHGDAILGMQADGSPMGAFLEDAARRGWTVIPGSDYRATPGPKVSEAVVDEFRSHLRDALTQALASGIDGIFLILHGAMVSESDADVEGTLLAEVRVLCGSTPVAAVLDLHANVSRAMTENADVLLAYRKNPHTDAAETATRATELFAQMLASGGRLKTHLAQAPLVWAPTVTGSAGNPMKRLLDMARKAESNGIVAVSVCPGFAHADTPDTGVSFIIVYDPASQTHAAIKHLGDEFVSVAIAHSDEGILHEECLTEAVSKALSQEIFPALIVEPADNIGGGAPGDATWVLQDFISQNAHCSAVSLTDPQAVKALENNSEGEVVSISVGGWSSDLAGAPVAIEAVLKRRSNGSFHVEDPHSHIASMSGLIFEMGPSVLLESDGILILLTSNPTPPMDLGQWRCMGVDPESLRLIGIKAAVAHRQAYDPIAGASFTVSTPGPCTSDLGLLQYHKIRRPVFPLDPIQTQS